LLRYSLKIAVTLLIVASADPVLAQSGCSAQQGQLLIEQGRYRQAVNQFTCVINAQPTAIEGYRGRIEAQLFLGLYADAMRDYGLVTAVVIPADGDAVTTLLAGYAARLADDPHSVSALTGASFARWWLFHYAEATHLLNDLLAIRPNDLYGTLFRGSSRLLRGATNAGVADLDTAIALDPENPHLHWIAADAYTYGLFTPEQAFLHALLALGGGLDTPRVHAILASAYLAFGNLTASVEHIDRHLDLVMTELVTAPTLFDGDSLDVAVVPGRVVEIPVPAVAGQTIAIVTSSKDYWDTIAVLLAPDGTPVAGSDDGKSYFAAFEWPAAQTAIYRLRVTFFEAVNSGTILVARK
jgi:tetratricopeptide (TPR) repeat protein